MELRLADDIKAVHKEVKTQNSRIGTLEVAHGKTQFQVRWVWRTAASLMLAAAGWLGTHVFSS